MSFQHILAEEGIWLSRTLPLSECRIVRPYLLGDGAARFRSVTVFLVPYLVRGERKNISAYAVSRDYHLYMKELFARILPRLSMEGTALLGFADHSPIDERHAASRAGLGVIGDNGLFINERYGSYVFIGELISTLAPEAHGTLFTYEGVQKGGCLHCGACKRACVSGCLADSTRSCLSAVTQKKGLLTAEERELLLRGGSAWGCDICQDVCPMNRHAEETKIPFFLEARTPFLCETSVRAMKEEEFSLRAYAWRRRETVLRNLAILEEEKENR